MCRPLDPIIDRDFVNVLLHPVIRGRKDGRKERISCIWKTGRDSLLGHSTFVTNSLLSPTQYVKMTRGIFPRPNLDIISASPQDSCKNIHMLSKSRWTTSRSLHTRHGDLLENCRWMWQYVCNMFTHFIQIMTVGRRKFSSAPIMTGKEMRR